MKRIALPIAAVAACCLAAAGLFLGAARILDVFTREQTPEFVGDYRAIARDVPPGPVAMLCGDAEDVSPIERTKLAVLDWELFPDAVRPIEKSALAEWKGSVVDSVHVPDSRRRLFEDAGFAQLASNGSAAVWGRRADSDRRPGGGEVSLAMELVGAFTVLALLALAWAAVRGGGFRFKALDLLLAALAFAALSAVSLKIGLSAPNGFAVYAGKAKLFLAAHGVPQGFWTAPEYAVCQPSYPPGMVVPAIVSFSVSGGFGEIPLQLFVPLVLALLYLEIVGKGQCSPIRRLIALSFVLSPLAMKMSAGYYAEPMAALLAATGVNALCAGSSRRGWALVGAAALFRTEFLVVAAALLAAEAWRGGFAAVPIRVRLADAAICLAPGAAWCAFAAFWGARLQGFDFLSVPSFQQMLRAAWSVAQSAAIPRNGVAAVLLATLASAWRIAGAERARVAQVAMACAALPLAGCVLAGFNGSAHFGWILDGVMPRQAWLVASLLLVRPAKFRGRA